MNLEATENNGNKIHLEQLADKDLLYCNDSSVSWETSGGDILTMTCHVYTEKGTVTGVRKFVRHHPAKQGSTSRKMSAPF